MSAGDALNIPIIATGTGPLFYSGVALPSGVSIHPTTGVISGTITAADDYPVQIQASPHTITATARGVSESVVINVTPLQAALADTGGVYPAWLAAASLLTVLLGAAGLAPTRLRARTLR